MPEISLRAVLTPNIKRMLLGVGLNAVGNGLTLSLLLVYLHQIRDIPADSASFLLSWMAVVGLVCIGFVGYLIDRVGPLPVLFCGLVLEAVGVGLWSTVHTFANALAVGTIVAMGGASIWPPQAALISRMAPPENRQRVYGINFMLLNAGLGLGGLIGALLIVENDAASFERLYIINSFCYITYFVAALTIKGVSGKSPDPEPPPAGQTAGPGGYREVFADRRIIRLSVASLLLLVCGYASVEAGLAVFTTTQLHLSPKWLGVIFGVNTFSIVALQAPILRRMNGRSRTRLLGFVGLLWGASWAIVAITTATTGLIAVTLLCVSQLVFAVGETLWSPISPAIANDLAPEHLRGRYNAVVSLQWGLSGSIGPLIAGLTLGRGHALLWTGILVAGSLIAAYFLTSLRSQLTPEQDGRVIASA